jgi:hypothetical protein
MFKAVEFTKANLQDLRKDLDAVLSRYSKESEVHFNVGNISFNTAEATIKLTATLADANGVFRSADADAFDMFAKLDSISLKLNERGVSKTLGNVRFVGYKSRNRKYPYIVEQISTGSRYKMDAHQARRICPNTERV